jgi:hypothetical protein
MRSPKLEPDTPKPKIEHFLNPTTQPTNKIKIHGPI